MLKLALIGDLHFPFVEEPSEQFIEARKRFFDGFLQQFLSVEADWHISLGDLTNLGRQDELEYVFGLIKQSSKRSFCHVLGNHDTYSMPKKEILAITGQPRYQAIDREEAVLLFLDTTKEMDYEIWGGEMETEQLEWLEEQILRSGSKPVLVFAHHPVYNTTSRSRLENLSIDPAIDVFSILQKKEGLGFYFCGHNHVHSIVQQEQWHFIQTAACLDQPGFRLVEVDEQGINIKMIDVDDEQLTQHAPAVYGEMNHFRYTPDAQGEKKDQEYSYRKGEVSWQKLS